jgi:predicted TIM-barrel enzyme
MASIKRADIVAKFAEMAERRLPIIGGGAGTGLSAKCEEAGGIDLIIIYNSGRYRMAGRGSSSGLMAYGNANAIVKEMALEILPVVKRTPVLAGVNGTDPFLIMPVFLRELKELGLLGRAELPDDRHHRRQISDHARGDRDPVRPGDRHDQGGPRA